MSKFKVGDRVIIVHNPSGSKEVKKVLYSIVTIEKIDSLSEIVVKPSIIGFLWENEIELVTPINEALYG